MAVDGLLSLRWNNHSSSFLKQLSFLRDKETYSDLTLVCGGQFYQVHRLVVSGCSEYFRAILEHTPCRHPAVVLQDLPPRHLEALLSYMYLGQVSVPQDQLGGLIRAAECLAIKGLAVPDEATPTPTPPPPPHQECRSRPAPAWEDGLPHPKRRRQDEGEASSSPGPPAHKDDSGRSSRGSSRGSSPQLVTPSATPHQNTLSEDTMTQIKVEEDEGNPREVKCEGESIFGLPDPCGDLTRQQEVSHGEDGQTAYNPTTGNTNSILQQYPSQPQSFEEVVSQALPRPSGMHEEAGQGWESGQGKGDLATAVAPPFLLESFTPQQEPVAPTHHTSLHQREPGMALRIHNTAPQDATPAPLTAATLPMLPLPCTLPGEREGEVGGRVGREWRCGYPDCGYVTDRESWLKQHYRKHTGEKPFGCPLCSFRSAQKGNVNVHIKRVHYGGSFHPTSTDPNTPTATPVTSAATPAVPVPNASATASKHALLQYLDGKEQTTVPKVAEWGV